jgi:hypothetical protein
MRRRAWLFAGSELAGQRAAVVMSLAIPGRLPTHLDSAASKNCHNWHPGR